MRISDWSSDVCSSDLADNRLCPGRQHSPDRIGIDILADQIDIRENRRRPGSDHAACRRKKAARGHNHFIDRPNAQRTERQFQSQRTVGERYGVRHATKLGERWFEGTALVAMNQRITPTPAQTPQPGGTLITYNSRTDVPERTMTQ